MTKYIVEEVTDANTIEFADYILPNEDLFLAGGAFKRLFHLSNDGDLIGPSRSELFYTYNKDYDLFSYSEEGFQSVKKYFELEFSEYELSAIMPRSYGDSENSLGYARKTASRTFYMDLVYKYFGSPEEVLDQFDFTVTQCALYKKNGLTYLVYGESFKKDLKNRVLAYASTPERSESILGRLIQYVNYGFIPSDATIKQGLAAALKKIDGLRNVEIEDLLKPDSVEEIQKISTILQLFKENDKGLIG